MIDCICCVQNQSKVSCAYFFFFCFFKTYAILHLRINCNGSAFMLAKLHLRMHIHLVCHTQTLCTLCWRDVSSKCVGKKRYGSVGLFTLYRTHSYTLLTLQLNISPCHCGHICRKYFVANFVQLFNDLFFPLQLCSSFLVG